MLRTLQFKKFKRTLKNQTLPPLKQTFKKKGKINLGHFSLKNINSIVQKKTSNFFKKD